MPTEKLAILIDADNAQSSIAAELLAEVSRYGTATIKRAYGDWTTPNLKGWKETLQKFAIQPIQQFGYTVGKNATDSALIIDAMDLLHGKSVGGFCIVSSDSDYTRLAMRIREAGFLVYGFGEQKTPQAFVAACDKFIYTEILRSHSNTTATKPLVEINTLKDILVGAILANVREDGWSSLASVGAYISKTHPAFDPRNYGVQKLGELVKKQPFIEIKEIINPENPSVASVYVKIK